MTAEIKVLLFAEGTPVQPPGEAPPVNLINQKFRTIEQIDAVTTGANAVSVPNTSSIMTFTNALLTSLSEIPGASTSQLLIVVNRTGNSIIIRNGTLLTGTGEDLEVANGAAVFMAHVESLGKFLIVGGSGGGGGGASQKAYPLLNNQAITDVTGLLLDATKFTSYFLFMEVERIGGVTYRQTIDAKAVFDGAAWSLVMGGYIGSDLVQDAIVNTTDVLLATTAGGQVRYSTGNLAAHVKTNLKVSLMGIKI